MLFYVPILQKYNKSSNSVLFMCTTNILFLQRDAIFLVNREFFFNSSGI